MDALEHPFTVQQHQDWIEHKMPPAERDCDLLLDTNETLANGTDLNCSDAMLQQELNFLFGERERRHLGSAVPLCRANLIIWNYVAPVYLIAGICLNCLAVFIWLRPLPRRHAGPLSNSIVMLACCDVLSLYSGFLRHYARKNSLVHLDVQDSSAAACKLTEFVVYFSLSLSTWLIALIAAERCALVLSAARGPRLARSLAHTLTGKGPLALLTLLCCAFNGHIFFTRVLQPENGRAVCINSHEPHWQLFLAHVWPPADLVFTTALPNTVSLLVSGVLIHRLRGKALISPRSSDLKNGTKHSFVAKHSRRITVTLLCIVAFYVACQLPAKLWLIVKPAATLRYTHVHLYFSERLAWTAMLMVQYGANVFNFAVYSLANRHFRNELRRLCCRKQRA